MNYNVGDLVYIKTRIGLFKSEIRVFRIMNKIVVRNIECSRYVLGPYTEVLGYVVKEYGNESAKLKIIAPKKNNCKSNNTRMNKRRILMISWVNNYDGY